MREIELTASAAEELEKVYKTDEKLFFRFITAIETLKTNPYQDKHLKGRLAGDYSLYIGNYRVIYTIHKRKLVVYVVDLGDQWKDLNNIKIKNA
ncbi:MAG: type II toxin-antitoxin system mRNA interferase toxin, RelE/StbE family [Candidatus Omnitrophota bacterium]